MIRFDVAAEATRELAAKNGVCSRPLIRRVTDRATGETTTVPIPCGATLASKCPACADKARRLRIHQCAEGWHLAEEPEDTPRAEPTDDEDKPEAVDELERTVRSTRRRQDVPDLPRVPMEDRTVGRAFEAPDGKTYRPSMFVTLTLPSYGAIGRITGAPLDMASYDYRRAAMDAMHFPRLFDRWVQNLRRTAGYKVQYFAAIEEQRRLAPHVHLAMRGVVPRELLRQVTEATYFQLWWPPVDEVIYEGDHMPVWDHAARSYIDPDTRAYLPTWDEAMYELEEDPDARPAHVMRFGTQVDAQGIIAPSPEADRAVRYLTKYLSKGLGTTYVPDTDEDGVHPAYLAHVDRMHREVQYLPCSPQCPNWLRFGVQPDGATLGLVPGRCLAKAHDREHLGLGGRRVLVSRKWSGKTLKQHKADRADVVRQALEAAGITPTEARRCAAEVLDRDGKPRFVWEDIEVTPALYAAVIMRGISERQRWRAEYDGAKQLAPPVDDCSATLPILTPASGRTPS